VRQANIPLSCGSHSLKLYNQLPYGWRSTPRSEFTDIYMWKQFIGHKGVRQFSTYEPTVLYFKRGYHPGWSADQRKDELKYWFEIIKRPNGTKEILNKAYVNTLQERADLKDKWLVIKGYSGKGIQKKILNEVKKYWTRFIIRKG